jgi:hypothetical protein
MLDAFVDFEDARRWLAWRAIERNGKPTKTPCDSDGNPIDGTAPANWLTRLEAEGSIRELAALGLTAGLGIALGDLDDDTYLAGADLDSSIRAGTLDHWAAQILVALQTYAEVSPSGNGLKAFFSVAGHMVRDFLDRLGVAPGTWGTRRGIPGLNGANHGPAIEIYCSHRFFAVTGRLWSVDHPRIVLVNSLQLADLVKLIPKRSAAGSGEWLGGNREDLDNSRSGKAWRAALALAAKSLEEMCKGLRDHPDPEVREWAGEVDDRQLERLWDRGARNPAAREEALALGLSELDARLPPQLDEPDLGERRADPMPTTVAELVESFNKRYAVVNEAGKALIVELVVDPLRHRTVLSRIHFEDFRKLYMNRTITVRRINPKDGKEKDITKSFAEWWLDDPRRCQYIGGVVFDPTGKSTPEFWNLWTGFAVVPAPGDWSLMQDHIERVICSGDAALNKYLLDYIARMFQQPDKPGEVAIVLRGRRGAGKGIFLNWLWRAWGQHACHISNAKHLVGNFNAHLRDCVMLFADEAFFAGDRAHEGVLKALITEPSLPIEGKYQNLVEVINMLHIFISSNSDWVVPAAIDERRFCVSDVADNRVGNRSYFADIAAQMENGGLAALIHDMLDRDISGFEVRDVPQTAALKTQKTLSLSSLESWWQAVLSRGFLWKSKHGAPWFRAWQEFYTTELLMRSYLQWCSETHPYDRKRRQQLGAFFTRVYQASRPLRENPVYEIESIDRRELEGIPNHGQTGGWLIPPKALDEIAIVSLPHRPGYRIGTLEEARARFLEVSEVEADWTDE